MSIIIFGTKGKKTVTGTGKFYCTQCRQERPYEHIKVTKHASVYFIPIFKLDDIGEYIECKVCQTKFEPVVKNLKPPAPRPDGVFCMRCNIELPGTFSFCPKCGEKLS